MARHLENTAAKPRQHRSRVLGVAAQAMPSVPVSGPQQMPGHPGVIIIPQPEFGRAELSLTLSEWIGGQSVLTVSDRGSVKMTSTQTVGEGGSIYETEVTKTVGLGQIDILIERLQQLQDAQRTYAGQMGKD